MNSKEALQNIRDYHDETVIDNYCTYIENDFEEELDTIEKDLEVLEIIKRKKVAIFVIPLCKNAYDYSMKTSGFERLTDKEFRLIKEWLEK